MKRTYGGLSPDKWKPLRLWPPGYPMLIASFMNLGVPAPTAAVVVAATSSAICILLLGSLYITRLPPLVATPLLLVTILMPSFLFVSGMAWSETPCLALTIVSLMCMVNWTESIQNKWRWIFAAGVAGGLAWCVRNSAVALFATSGVFLCVHLLWQPFQLVAKSVVLWLSGWCVAASWLVARNLLVFGEVNPYYMPPSELSLSDNLRQGVTVIARDLSASPRIGSVMTDKYVAIGLIVVAVALVAMWCRTRTFGELRAFLTGHRVEVLLVVYCSFSFAVPVLARTVYRWGEAINSRHFVPMYWAIWLLFGLCSLNALKRLSRSSHAHVTLAVIITLAICMQLRDHIHHVQTWRQDQSRWERNESARLLGQTVPADKIVLTDEHERLRIHGDIHARRLDRPQRGEDHLAVDDIEETAAAGLLWGIVIWDRDLVRNGVYGKAVQEICLNRDQFPQFQEVSEDGAVPLVLQYKGTANSLQRNASTAKPGDGST